MLLQLVELDEYVAKERAKSLNSTNEHKSFDDLLAEEPAQVFANINLRTAGFVNCILVSFFLCSAHKRSHTRAQKKEIC